MPNIEWTRLNDEGDEEVVSVPAKYVVCWDCEGDGKTLTENLRCAFTSEEFNDCFDDDESREEYFKGGKGRYGVTCKTCKGRTTIAEPDTSTALGKEYAKYQERKHREDMADLRTMRMESGDYGY